MGSGTGFLGGLLGPFFVVGSGSLLALAFLLFLSLLRFGSGSLMVWTKSWLLGVRIPTHRWPIRSMRTTTRVPPPESLDAVGRLADS